LDPLLNALMAFSPRTRTEGHTLARIVELVRAGNPWDRSLPLHVTASALVLHPQSGRVLLRWHQRQQAWLQIGGHGDPGESDPIAVVLREGVEETGLGDLRPWPDAGVQHVVIVPVPANKVEPAHQHADIRFFLATDVPDSATPEDPVAQLRWLAPDDAIDLTTEANVQETIRRAATVM
jgi:8-oxo-dGTP pyrophosphatase MutT (NUDIX family)